jgi:hypothetical protein
MTERPIKHLNQIELSRRWSLSPRTLERWRWLRCGPRYLKIGGRVVYRLEDIEASEAERTHKGNPINDTRASESTRTFAPMRAGTRQLLLPRSNTQSIAERSAAKSFEFGPDRS